MVSGHLHYPRAVVVMEWLLAILGVGGLRLSLRVSSTLHTGLRAERRTQKRLLIVGAGDHAESLAREVGRHADLNFHLVGFVDDDFRQARHGDPRRPGSRPGGAHYRGRRAGAGRAGDHCGSLGVRAGIRRLIALCESLPVRLRITPGFQALVKERGEPPVRDVAPEDLLRRPAVQLDLQEIAGYLASETVLITGAGGSIGSNSCGRSLVSAPSGSCC